MGELTPNQTYHLIELVLLVIIAFAKGFNTLISKAMGRESPHTELRKEISAVRHDLRDFRTVHLPEMFDRKLAPYARKREVELEFKRVDGKLEDLQAGV